MQTENEKLAVVVIGGDPAETRYLTASFGREGCATRAAATLAEGRVLLGGTSPDAVLLDPALPDGDGLALLKQYAHLRNDAEIIVLVDAGQAPTRRDLHALGARALERPIEGDQLATIMRRAAERRANNPRRSADVIGSSPMLLDALDVVGDVAASDASVLIYGETGTGKEVLANAIHRQSARAGNRFVKVNCAAIPADLLESELFGHKKGAFTGAAEDNEGLFARADKGSLLLDEVGEMPPLQQAKLLRVLQEREYMPVGSNQPRKVDFRLICTTNINIPAALKSGQLREDLYFRISTISLRLPPLRDRPEDVPPLAHHFLAKYRTLHRRDVVGFARDAEEALLRYNWPGNVRDLEGAIEHAVILARGPQIVSDDLPDRVRRPSDLAQTFRLPERMTLAELERQVILQTLRRTKWNIQSAARILGVYRSTLYSKLRKYGLEAPRSLRTQPAS